jgi:cell division protein FtsI/penicillin-binding protein 2
MNISVGIRKLTYVFMVLFLALSGSLVYWQVVVADQVTGNIHNGRAYLPNNIPKRGRILDRNGVVLAESVLEDGVYVRKYTEDSLASVIGVYINPNYGITGLEATYNDYLNGKIGMSALDNSFNKLLHRPPVGNDIYLTIDIRIQRLVDQHYDDPLPSGFGDYINPDPQPREKGAIVVSDPSSGDVLAMVNRPKYDPNKLVHTLLNGDSSYYDSLDKDPRQPLLNRATQQTYIPGSIYKTVTLAASLDSGKGKLDDPWTRDQALGPVTINGQQFGPSGNNISNIQTGFPVTSEFAFAHSDNVIFAQMGVKMGQETWVDYNHRFYIDKQIPFDLPITVGHVLKPDDKGQQVGSLDDNELAANAFGQGFDNVTPMQMVLFDNLIANNGEMVQPRLVNKITSYEDGNSVMQTYGKQTLSTPIKKETATQVRQALYAVIQCGPGVSFPAVRDAKYGWIGKTGTAQTGDFSNTFPHSWMLTQGPYSVANPDKLPKLTIIAMKEKAGESVVVLSTMINSIYNDIFEKGYVQADTTPARTTGYCCSTKLYPGVCN